MQDAIILYENGKAIGGEGHPTNASDITFDNTGTDLVSENVEGAIKEVNAKGTPRTDIAYIETGSTASRTYRFGDLIYIGGTLYYCASGTIASGATFTVGTNVFPKKVSDFTIKLLYSGAVNFSGGYGTLNFSSKAGKVFPICAQCQGADVPCVVSLSPNHDVIQVLLPISLGYTGSLNVNIFGIDLS